MRCYLCAVVMGLSVLAALGTHAQVLYTLESMSPEQDGYFGFSVSSAGDVDNDGYADVIVGAPWEDAGATDAGRAYVFGGNGGTVLHTLQSPNPENNGEFGRSVSGAGDMDNDGCADVIVGAHGEGGGATSAGRVYVFSGATGAPLYALQSPNPENYGSFGLSVSGAGDVNGDGYPDVVVGADLEDGGTGNAGRAYIFSGNGGVLLYTLESPNAQDSGAFGWWVSGAGDLNNDGYNDVIVGARNENHAMIEDGRAYVFSGDGGFLLYELQSPDPQHYAYFGLSVSGAGDVDNDTYDDVIVGSYAGRAHVFSGNGGGLLYTLESPNPSGGSFGRSVSAAGDVNDDGYADVAVGASFEGAAVRPGRAYIFGGDGCGHIYTLESSNPENGGDFGASVSGAGDVNNDGHTDVIVGAREEDGGAMDAGRAYVFDGIEVPVELASFRADPVAGSVRLVWTTFTERDNLGFNLGRARAETGPFARVNEHLIPGAGTTSIPHTYSYVDEMVEPGAVYWYQLEDVALSGKRTSHGPVQVFVPGQPGLDLEVLGGVEPAFALSFAGPGWASLSLHDVAGRLAATLWEGDAPNGGGTVVRPQACRTLPPGLYAAVLSQHDVTVSRRIALLR